MYYPYLRGRQFELLALRELIENRRISQKITPVIEPVKASSTLRSVLDTYIANHHPIVVVCNPTVGDFESDVKRKEEYKVKFDELMASDFVFPLYIVKNKTIDNVIDKEKYIYCVDSDALKYISNMDDKVLSYFVPEGSIKRRLKGEKILLEDRFKRLERNSSYADNIDEFFSEDHIYYLEDNYSGFGDYSIIGNEYSETGFAPYAVAIHLVYFGENNELRVHHFVSDRMDGIEDTAGKFGEALRKIVGFEPLKEVNTYGLEKFRQLYKTGQYSGLGIAKKLSIMHHLELMSDFLDGKQ